MTYVGVFGEEAARIFEDLWKIIGANQATIGGKKVEEFVASIKR